MYVPFNPSFITKLLISLLLAASSVTTASTVAAPVSAVNTPVEAPKQALEAPRTIDSIIHDTSIKYGVSEALMRRIIACESTNNPNAIGDGGASYGLVQIHLPSWPEITPEQALDPAYAIDFLGRKLASGQGNLWTCYRLLQ